MRHKALPLAFGLCFSAATALGQAPQLIQDVRVFDGERLLAHRSVLIQDGKVSKIGGAGLRVPGAEIIDGRDRTLLPGLIDAHVHIPDQAEEASRQALLLGVTTQLDMFSGGGRVEEGYKKESGCTSPRTARLTPGTGSTRHCTAPKP